MMKFLRKKRMVLGNKGFSLVELIIVIAIMAVLMAVLAPQLIKYVEKSRIQSDESAAAEILNVVKIALTDETIYTNIVDNETVTWTGPAGTIAVNITNANAQAALTKEITDTLGSTTQTIKSNLHKNEVYTITIDITDGVATAKGTWPVPAGGGAGGEGAGG